MTIHLVIFGCWMMLTNIISRTISADSEIPPRIIMLEVSGLTPNDDTIYKAIRAHLSATSIQLERLTVDGSQFDPSHPLRSASTLAAEHNAALLFWITKETTISTIFFYDGYAAEPRIHTRPMDLASERAPSRFDTIGNAVSTIVEQTISVRKRAGSRPAAKPSQPSEPRQPSAPDRKLINLFALYAGSYFERRSVTNGLGFGFSVLPVRWAALTFSYTQGLPLTLDSEKYRLTLSSRNITAAASARLPSGFVEFRFGVAWSIDIRSYEMTASSAAISPRPGKVSNIQSIAPFVAAIWSVSDLVGFKTELGADAAFNEKAYKIWRNDGSEALVLAPFRVKLTYKVGVLLKF